MCSSDLLVPVAKVLADHLGPVVDVRQPLPGPVAQPVHQVCCGMQERRVIAVGVVVILVLPVAAIGHPDALDDAHANGPGPVAIDAPVERLPGGAEPVDK